jgi:GntR family transcriptional regulator, transcriptional repressor for pyruvate dehydrogenase complex
LDIDFEPIERITVSEEIIKQLISLINTGKLKPGSKLPSERELMEKFHVSRSSIREALHSLTMIGLLETYPGAGTFVSKHLTGIIAGQLEWSVLLGNRELLELTEVREPLEIQAAGLAAERTTSESVQKLRLAIDNYLSEQTGNTNLLDAEMAVHITVAEISGNRTLLRIIQTLQTMLKEYRIDHRIGFYTSPGSNQDYLDILKAVELGDAEAARSSMARHLQKSKRKALVEQINIHSEHNEPEEKNQKGTSDF